MKKISYICPRCKKTFKIGEYFVKQKIKKYNATYCRGCIQHFEYEKGNRDRNLLKNSVKPQKGISMKERCNWTDEQYEKYKNNISKRMSGTKNPMYGDYEHTKGWRAYGEFCKGKTLEEIYGKEKGEQLKLENSKRFSGSGNPMYGKPAPSGSGNGWSGWYKNYYFRSLLELGFLLKNSNIQTAENIKIPYTDWNGTKRTYHPDFISNNTIIEIKPKRLVNSKSNKLKFKAAESWCLNNNFNFKILTEEDVQKPSYNQILELKNSNELHFIDRYEKKFLEYKGGSLQ